MDSLQPSRPTPAKRVATLLIAAIAATAIALASAHNFVEDFGAFLSVLLYLFTPWTANNLVDFYWVRNGHYSVREIFNAQGMYGRWNWRGLLAYGVGFVSLDLEADRRRMPVRARLSMLCSSETAFSSRERR